MRAATVAFAAVVSSRLLCGQAVSFGFVGGVNLTRDFPISRVLYQDSSYPAGLTTFDLFSDTHSFLAGLSAEVRFGNRFSLAGNALRRTLNHKARFTFPDGSSQDGGGNITTTWEWPILLKYRMPALGAMRPFVETGPSFRTRQNQLATEPSQIGATLGVGTEFRAGRLRISPAIRYTRWQYDGNFPRYATKRDQIEFITGLSYATSVPSWKVQGRKLRFGLIAGAPFTGSLKRYPRFPGWDEIWGYNRLEEEQGYIGGLAAELELRRFSIEVNGLYRPLRAYDVTVGGLFDGSRDEFTVLTWQFPVLVKYHWRPESKVRPVVETGPSFRLSGNRNGYSPSWYGLTVGGGLETHYKTLKIGPVVRYTRWGPGTHGLVPNQVELLVGFTF